MEFYFDNYENLDEGLRQNLGLITVAITLSIPKILPASETAQILSTSKTLSEVQQRIEQAIPQEFKDKLGYNKATALNIIARTLWAEAKGEGENGLRAVASVIWNRAYHNSENLTKICFAPKQFSCWNAASPLSNTKYSASQYEIKIPSDVPANKKTLSIWEDCKQIALEMLDETFVPVSGLETATAYARTDSLPSDWKMTNKKVVGKHTFGTIPQRFWEYEVTGTDDASLELITKGLFTSSTFRNRSEFYDKIKDLNPSLRRKFLPPGTIVRIPKKA